MSTTLRIKKPHLYNIIYGQCTEWPRSSLRAIHLRAYAEIYRRIENDTTPIVLSLAREIE